jgi:hypothetical protein
LLARSYKGALERGIEHSITEEDLLPLPNICKYLGVHLEYKTIENRSRWRLPNLAVIDRIDPERGYVPGNVQIISNKANMMKFNASREELIIFAKNVLKIYK